MPQGLWSVYKGLCSLCSGKGQGTIRKQLTLASKACPEQNTGALSNRGRASLRCHRQTSLPRPAHRAAGAQRPGGLHATSVFYFHSYCRLAQPLPSGLQDVRTDFIVPAVHLQRNQGFISSWRLAFLTVLPKTACYV